MESAATPSAIGRKRQNIEKALEILTNMETRLAKSSTNIAAAIKYFCVQAGKGHCVEKVDAWTAACSGPDAAACTSADAALHKCITDPSSGDSEQPQLLGNSS